MVDVDFFKRINDEYGHPVGDLVLKNLAHTLQKSSRKCDLVARYGGEEFTVVLPETNIDGAVVIAEKIRKAVEKNKIFYKNEKGLNITISIGAAEFKAYENELQLFARADEALYKAKNTGRNKVVAL